MLAKISALLAVATIFAAGHLGAIAAHAQDAPPALAAQLKSQYKLAKVGMDSSGWTVTEPGTVLVIQKGGILGVPPASLGIGTATYKDGELKGPNVFFSSQLKDSRQLTIGEKIYIFKMDVHAKSDKVGLFIIECDSCNNVQQLAAFKAYVVFQFPKGYLDKADASQVQDVISQVLAPDSASSDAQQSQPQQQSTATQPAATQPAAAQPASGGAILQNADVIKLVKAGLDDAIVISKISSSQCQFDTSTDALVQLKQSGVSSAIIKAMLAASK